MTATDDLQQKIADLAEAAIRDQVFPGCQVGYIRGGEAVVLPFGRFGYESVSPVVSERTVYDVASITKSVPTNSLILKLIEDGRLGLDDKAARYLPEIHNDYREQILVRHLLTYTVIWDLPAGMSTVAKETPDRLIETLFEGKLKAAPGKQYFYTNPPAILLGMIAERVTGQPLDKLAKEVFFGPLKMERTDFDGGMWDAREVAPTAKDFRGLVQGQPHDETAWALRKQGIIAGHAGLFTTSADLLRFAQMLLNKGELGGRRYFEPRTVAQMHTNQLEGIGERTGLGWEINLGELPASVRDHGVFGKTGFTGCALMMDPVEKVAMVYLSNRTYPERPASREGIQEFRRGLVRLVMGS